MPESKRSSKRKNSKSKPDAVAADKAKQRSKRNSRRNRGEGNKKKDAKAKSKDQGKPKSKDQGKPKAQAKPKDQGKKSGKSSGKSSKRGSQSKKARKPRKPKMLNASAAAFSPTPSPRAKYTPRTVSPRNLGRGRQDSGPPKLLREVTRDPNEPVLFVGNVPHDCTRNDIIATFTKLCPTGEIRACKMPTAFMKHLGMRHHRGFAFVVFNNQKDMAGVLDIAEADGIVVAGYEDKPLEVKAANDPKDMPNVTQKRKDEERRAGTEDQIFIGGVPWTCTEQHLREYFGKHGEIEQLFMPRWPTDPKTGLQKHKGYAFIRFTPKTFSQARKLADKKGEKFLPDFPNIPIKINVAKGTEPAFPKSKAAQIARMQRVYNPYNHPAAHLYPSALPMGVYKQVYGNAVPPQMPMYGYQRYPPQTLSGMRQI